MRVPYLVGLVVTGGAFFALFGTSQSSTHVDKTKVNECSAMQTDWTVACVGDSITLGMRTTPYPTLVAQALLKKGATVTVGNYGVSGATAGTGFAAYTRTDEFKEAILSRPDVVVLMMGTNDGKRKVWKRKGGSTFLQDLSKVIASFPTAKRVVLLTPIPAYSTMDGLFDLTAVTYCIPRLVLSLNATSLIPEHVDTRIPFLRIIGNPVLHVPEDCSNSDLPQGPVNEAMVDSYFFDGIHPTRRGNELIADIVVDALCRNNLSRKS